MIKWVIDYWRTRQRTLDLQILWPQCLAFAPDLDHAKAAFAMHAFNDHAWLCLGEPEIIRRIEALSGGQ